MAKRGQGSGKSRSSRKGSYADRKWENLISRQSRLGLPPHASVAVETRTWMWRSAYKSCLWSRNMLCEAVRVFGSFLPPRPASTSFRSALGSPAWCTAKP